MAYPATPELAAAFERVSQPDPGTPVRPPTWSLVGTAVAAAIVAMAVIVGVLAPAQEAVADLFDRINIFQAEEIPSDLPTDIRGEQTTLEEASRRLGRPLALPAEADGSEMAPSKVLYQQFAPGGPQGVVLFFESEDAGAPFVLFEIDGGARQGPRHGRHCGGGAGTW